MNYDETMELKRNLKTEIKYRSYIFDYDEKMRLAIWFELPIDTYLLYSFDDYQKAKDRMHQEFELMRKHCEQIKFDTGESFWNTPYVQWKSKFRKWANASNIESIQPFVI